MKTLNILVVTPSFDKGLPRADEELIRRIQSVSRRIKVTDASQLLMAEMQGDNTKKEELDARWPRRRCSSGLYRQKTSSPGRRS